MDARNLLLLQHALIHTDGPDTTAGLAPVTGKPLPDRVWARLDEAAMRAVLPGHNSIAWTLWHMARAEDVGVNGLIRGYAEVLDRDGWLPRIGAGRRDIGTGWSREAVTEFSAAVDIAALRAYRDAVAAETRRWLRDADLDVLDAHLGTRVRDVMVSAFPAPIAGMLSPLFEASSGAWTFARLGLWHNFYHLFEVAHVMELQGVPVFGPDP